MKKFVGRVTEKERDTIQTLFERRNGLTELVSIIKNDSELYERFVTDMGTVCTEFQEWWDDMFVKYHWESIEGGYWEIDFNTCEIYLLC